MRHESLLNEDWSNRCRAAWRSGSAPCYGAGDEGILASARDYQCGGFAAADPGLLSGRRGLRSTAAWATSVGLVDVSNVALLYRLRQCGDWLAMLVGQALVAAAPKASRGRIIRIIDATTERFIIFSGGLFVRVQQVAFSRRHVLA